MRIVAKRPFISTRSGIGNVAVGKVLDVDDAYAKTLIANSLAEEISAGLSREDKKGVRPDNTGLSNGRFIKTKWVVIASGPSLKKKDCEAVKRWREGANDRKVAVVNTTYQMAPWADVLYACDGAWWDHHIKDVLNVFQGELWTQDEQASNKYALNKVVGQKAIGLGHDKVHYGSNSGYQTINLVYLFGAVKIILLGFDMKYGAKGKVHWHGDHVGSLNRGCPVGTFIKNFPALAEDLNKEGISVINATRDTALDCFPKTSLEDALC